MKEGTVSMEKGRRYSPVWFSAAVAASYALLSLVWIWLSDLLMLRLAADPEVLTRLQTYKDVP